MHGQTVITTGVAGLTAGEVQIPVAAGQLPAYRAMPAGGRALAVTSPLRPKHPLDLVGELKAPVLGLYGGAPHGFHADYRSSYRAEPAKDGWGRALAWFRKHGVA